MQLHILEKERVVAQINVNIVKGWAKLIANQALAIDKTQQVTEEQNE